MNIQKQARLAAVVAITIGSLVLALVAFIIVWFGPTLNGLAQKEALPRESVLQLIKVIKGGAIGAPAGLCLALIASGINTLQLLRSHDEPVSRQNPK
jgi:hypothetical protein